MARAGKPPDAKRSGFVNAVRAAFVLGYSLIAALFFLAALALIIFACSELWEGLDPRSSIAIRSRFNATLESIGLLTIAVAALELGQTIIEEEVQREAHMSAPTRVRRFLSRFMVVIAVSLSIESLVSVFQLSHDDPSHLPHASSIAVAAALLLAGWGVFLKLNTSAEKLEPEAMQRAKSEDDKVE